ncbi:MAG TPA: sugar ABC transporter permease [Ktedonobacteraceae bacterium]
MTQTANTQVQQGTLHPPRRQGGRHSAWRPWLWLGLGILLMAIFQVYPMLNTIVLSFYNDDSTSFVGLKNYGLVFTNHSLLLVLWNNVLWLVVATILTVGLGLLVAVLVDKVRVESLVKAALFVPMAISFVGAGVIWRFVYLYAPANRTQAGLLNAFITSIGFQPQAWLIDTRFNNFALMIVYVWIWTGFCMVVLSASLKGIPDEIIEAAKIDGASGFTIFWRITAPMIQPTIVVVTTTMIINILKIFDVVYVMTGGDYNTNVVALQYYQELFTNYNYGVASALAVILLIAIFPVMYLNVRRIRAEEAQR